MDKFRIALDGDFIRPDGSPTFPSVDLTSFESNPDIEHEFLKSDKKFDKTAEIRAEELAGFDAYMAYTPRVTRNSIRAGDRLALVARVGAGYETFDVPACTEAGVALATAPDGVRRPVAVLLLTLILALTTKLLIKDRLVRAGPDRWADKIDHMGVGVVGKTLGMIGVGSSGAETLRLAKPLGMNFIAYDPYVDPETVTPLGVRMVGLEDVFRESDIVAIACTLTDETYHLVDAGHLALMKPTAFLINGARGAVVDQSALVEALRAGQIAGAGLDVLEREPPDPDEPIFEFDNVVLSPHALAWTDQCLEDCFTASIASVLDVMHGREPKNIVNCEILDNPDWRGKLASYRERFGD